ncbi:YegP family protein [Amycolatopsis keratiniphila]|uniref:DUF1508 domain-containing protein n=1 Tax=Amycolatopsis keratiniphila subsp. keratiniphila TaxID=227715 RepID=A0A1W2LV57_9PSEU|nr:hypothetical protein [Amycolatopsis keratiniphila]OLZ45156.1 DUF1508 domain-containing protein [Amycolatopsis keratiniphila subsp. nogabecina]ONF70214.1 DUF1508 domain-containing protein [Amycolatopsis keratiniphila subsp. keratiniphila]SDU41996.1 hypothetical protein SAMN04489733_4027 [Amycolatopsis keratiniphila]
MTRGNSAPKNPRFQLVQTGEQTLRWRLLGGNNVSLGSAPDDYPRAEECLVAIAWLSTHISELTSDFSHLSGGRWRWRLHTGDRLVAIASHAYGRRIEAQRGLDRFRSATTEASIGEGIETIADWRRKYRRDSGGHSPNRSP